MRSKSKKSLFTLTIEEKKEIKRKKMDARIAKMERRHHYLEEQAQKLIEKKRELIVAVLYDSDEEEEEMNEVFLIYIIKIC